MSNIAECNLVIELDNKSPDLIKIKKITERLAKTCAEDEEDSESLKALGHCYLIQNNSQLAHESYQKALILKGTEDPELWYGIGLMYYQNSNFVYAEPSFLKVLSAEQSFCTSSSLHLKLGLIYKRLSMWQEGLKHFNQCIEEEKTMGLIQSGFCYSKLGSSSEASLSFKSAYENSKTPYSSLCLGVFISKTDEPAAINYLKEGLENCTKNTIEELDLLYGLAKIQIKQKDLSEASNNFFKLLSKNSGDHLIWNSFGILCAGAGQSAQAFRCFIKASELFPESAEIWNNIGTLYWQSSQINESKLAYEKAHKFSSNPEQVKEYTKEFVEIDWDVSELPFIKRNSIVRGKVEMRDLDGKGSQGFVYAGPVSNGMVNNYAAVMGYFNYFRQMIAGRLAKQKNEDDTAAEILTDLAQLPVKRHKDSE